MQRARSLPAVLAAALLASGGCHLSANGPLWEHQLERSFTVAPGSTVRVELAGGTITTETGPAGTVSVLLTQAIDATTESEALDMLSDYEISAVQSGSEVRAVGRRKPGGVTRMLRHTGVRINATVTLPPDVKLDVQTSGGSIRVRGDRTALVKAQTSGGSISVDGGSGLSLGTSGGSIKVGRAADSLRATTSGGSITVEHLGPKAADVNLSTSGGSIRVGVDPAASLRIDADTSGGTVRVESLTFESTSQGRSHATGTINGGAGHLRAHTSGGSITVRGVAE